MLSHSSKLTLRFFLGQENLKKKVEMFELREKIVRFH